MGKGDKKTKKGKIFAGSYGNSRKRKETPTVVVSKPKVKKETEAKTAPIAIGTKKVETVAKKTVAAKKPAAKKPAAKKPVAKKTTDKK